MLKHVAKHATIKCHLCKYNTFSQAYLIKHLLSAHRGMCAVKNLALATLSLESDQVGKDIEEEESPLPVKKNVCDDTFVEAFLTVKREKLGTDASEASGSIVGQELPEESTSLNNNEEPGIICVSVVFFKYNLMIPYLRY